MLPNGRFDKQILAIVPSVELSPYLHVAGVTPFSEY